MAGFNLGFGATGEFTAEDCEAEFISTMDAIAEAKKSAKKVSAKTPPKPSGVSPSSSVRFR